jgi:hypothetical protein
VASLFSGLGSQRTDVPSRWMASIASDDALILPHRANPSGYDFWERHPRRAFAKIIAAPFEREKTADARARFVELQATIEASIAPWRTISSLNAI